ncbi:acyl-protein synthetase [Alistipes sp. ZOR0009]|uniref:LuxE/PaaK family acyltransferase n=1 Tax=Alistipes sp. ZOR0009 TaxID=1339253 RepID=UPI0006474F5A|nr:acyl-protein synthetase [Alistipes sp. ZOR0009]
MVDIEKILDIAPYSLNHAEKDSLMNEVQQELTQMHYQKCSAYKKMLDAHGLCIAHLPHYHKIPFLPVRLFKEFELRSVPQEDVVKTMTSSGTSGQAVSRIYLDRETSSLQTKALVKIVSSFIGSQRIPMLILDSSEVVKNRAMFSARGAGILGFSMFGSKRCYALNENMELDVDGVQKFLEEHKESPIFLFGFTFMIWLHFYNELVKKGTKLDLSKGILIHGGGWKKLVGESVTPEEFKKRLFDVCGIQKVYDYYGMVEQTGTIYMECEQGHLHCSIFSDIIIRRTEDFSVANIGEKGLIQVVSMLPKSYPGHSLLTEDEGVILGEDDCPCGRKGKYFKIFGRLKNAEVRGCSDTYSKKS